MKIPDTLIIGHQIYTIETKDPSWFRDTDKFGHCDFVGSTIAIANEGMANAHVVNTLLHECLHALWREYNLPIEHEEHIVTCLANGLTQLIRDNPSLLPLLKKVSL